MNQMVLSLQPYLDGASAFSTTTSPTLVQLENIIDAAVGEVAQQLEEYGYSATPPASAELAKRQVASLVVQVALWQIERYKRWESRGEDLATEEPREQLEGYIDRVLMGEGLKRLGWERSVLASDGLVFTGRTKTQQDDWIDDSNLVPPLTHRRRHAVPFGANGGGDAV